jgi:hypothetical protein
MNYKKVITSLLLITILFPSCLNFFLRVSGTLEDAANVKYISNSKKNIVFFNMHHIGTKSFYVDTKNKVDSLYKLGYTVYYELVSSDTNHSKGEFDTMVRMVRKISNIDFKDKKKGGDDYLDSLNNTIMGHKTKLIKKYGLINQRNYFLLPVDSLKIRRVDANIFDMITGYEKKYGKIQLEKYDLLTDFGAKYKNKISRNKKDYFLLGYRNELIANTVIKDTATKIVLMYGAYHFDGILDNLKAYDKTYKEVDKF